MRTSKSAPTAYDVVARELPPAERDDVYPKVVALAPGFGDYQSKTSRVIPLFELAEGVSPFAQKLHSRLSRELFVAGNAVTPNARAAR